MKLVKILLVLYSKAYLSDSRIVYLFLFYISVKDNLNLLGLSVDSMENRLGQKID